MAVVATGTFAGPVAALADMVAATEAFQLWTGMPDAGAARTRVKLIDYPGSAIVRPFAIVGFAEWRSRRGGFAAGVLRLGFEAAVSDPELADEDAAIEFMNPVGAVIQELHERAEDAGLVLPETALEWGPARSKNEAEDYLEIRFRCQYGLVNLP